MCFCRLASEKLTGLQLVWMLCSQELIQDVGTGSLNEKVSQEAEKEAQRDESEEVKESVEQVSPDSLFQVEDAEFHEDAIAEEHSVS